MRSPFALPPALSRVMTRPSVRSDWLMFFLSRSRAGSTSAPPALFAHSLPARSTMCNLPAVSITLPSDKTFLLSTRRVNTQCERDECLFILVSPTALRSLARAMSFRTSSGHSTGVSVRFMTYIPRPFVDDVPGSSTSRSCFCFCCSAVRSLRSTSQSKSPSSSL